MDNTALILARLQFGITLIYHFCFVALTLGLSVFIAVLETWFVWSDQPDYKSMVRFWGQLFIIIYTTGIVTGIVNEFEFGMNWSEFSRYAGGVFGLPLAFEGLLAFFVESTAIGIWVYGWNQLAKPVHLLVIWLVALSSNYSAFLVLAANSFMQQPAGYALRSGRLSLTDLTAIVTNPFLIYQYLHTVSAALMTTGLLVMAVSAYYLLNRRWVELARKSFVIGLVAGLVTSLLVIASGHFYNQYIAKVQPMKLAASEALWNTARPAPFILFAVINEAGRKNSFEVSVPGGLSLLAYNRLNTPVSGMQDLQDELAAAHGPGYYIPPVNILFWSLRVMVGIGFWLLLLTVVSLWYWRTGRIETSPLLLRTVVLSWPLPYVAIITGWLITEMGRQPWIVYNLQLTQDGISRVVSAATVGLSLVGYMAVYTGVTAAVLYIARHIIVAGPNE